MHLMVVVANQEEELPEFKKSLERAKELTDDDSIISGMLSSNKAEAQMPKDNKHIISLIEERLEKGKREYNEELDVHDGRDWMQETLEELLDACVYLSAQIIKIKERSVDE